MPQIAPPPKDQERTPEAAFERFVREQQYADLLKLADMLETHHWSKNLNRSDQAIINDLYTRIRAIADDIYLIHQFFQERAE